MKHFSTRLLTGCLTACACLGLAVLMIQPLGAKVRVACVGNSVTYGYLLKDREHDAYPAQLQVMLGEAYDVRNFGHSGATLLSKGHNPYVRLPEFRAALDFRPDIVVIHLGLNDTDPRNWPQHADDFIRDYRALIDSFRTANPAARVWICLMTPIFHDHPRFDSGTRLWHSQIQKRIRLIAETDGVGLIDLYTPLHTHPDLFPDALHPDATGARILAQTVAKSLTGDYGGLQLPPTYGDGMVIQRDRPITVQGTANAGERVSVSLSAGRRKATATAGADGRWCVSLPALPAGGPYVLDVKAKSRRLRFSDVWIGEVWLCSGQSNMEFTVAASATAREDLAAADTLTRLHLYNMPSIVPTYAIEWSPERLDSVNRLLYVLPGQWRRADRGNAAAFSAIAYNFGRRLADSLGCHVGLISNAVGGSAVESWIDRSTLEEDFPAILRHWRQNDFIMRWCRERAALNTKQSANPRQRHPYEPAYLFESAILPLEGYTLRGVLWYQGESNADNAEVHERLFPLLEQSWRRFWADERLPFYTVQLSSLSTRPSWPRFRDGQRRLADSLPATWMAVTTDVGDSLNVHPVRKSQVADRLLRAALCHTYGHTGLVGGGPAYTGMHREGRRLRLSFHDAEGLRPATGTEIVGFEVAGADGVYYPARATVSAGQVLVESAEVGQPVAVRYAWQAYTHANLVNAAGLPASTFRDERALYGCE